MSATHSPLLSQNEVTGLRNQARCDPVLPSSPEDEQLTPIPSTRSTPGPHLSNYIDTHSESACTEHISSGSGLEFHEQQQDNFQFGIAYDASDFSNNYLEEARFGDFPSTENFNEGNYFRGAATNQQEEPMSATSTTSRSANTISRKSTGLATMSSSQLMSPQLTDAASPGSGTSHESPTFHHRVLGGAPPAENSVDGRTKDARHDVYMQQTPTATGSSVDESPDLHDMQGRYSAPRVQVESYTRGDSPARAELLLSHGKKRRGSHSNSLLAAPETDSSQDGEYEDEPAWQHDTTTIGSEARLGVDPLQRSKIKDDVVMSLAEQTKKADVDAKNVEISEWLVRSSLAAPTQTERIADASRQPTIPGRKRAKSASNRTDLEADAFGLSRGLRAAQDAQIPGPGRLVQEESEVEEDGDEDFGAYADEAVASVDGRTFVNDKLDYFPPPPLDDEPRPQDAYPWIDPIYFPSREGTEGQPSTSTEAMMRFAKRARDLETVSRAATWGTIRRLSDGDLQRVFGSGGLFSRLSIGKDKDRDDWRQFKESVEQGVMKLLPKRNNSTSKRKQSEPPRTAMTEADVTSESGRKDSTHKRKESLQSLHERKDSMTASFRRLPSAKKPKSPKLNTSGLFAHTTNAASLVTNGLSPNEAHSPTHKWDAFKNAAREKLIRHSSREAPEPRIATLWTQSGGPPLPKLSSPPAEKEMRPAGNDEEEPVADAESHKVMDEKGIKMDLTPRQDMIIPTFDGFKMNVRDVNPRLPVYLVERLGQEQLRRYKKLVEFKVKHAQAIQQDKCESGSYCIEKGGLPTYFPAKITQKEPELSHTGFTAASTGDADEDEEAVADGVVSEAQFAPGIPMPPVKRLPAQFECPLCFTVKKFTKPSDWSKHVHEDLQPFTCTFPTCPDPKSFKRKADWVRHENERHRQLEWWQCTEEGCAHQCFRRDNFVQHLVREHKMPEPKAKSTKLDNKPAVRGPAKSKGRGNKEYSAEDKVLMMVEKCRRETSKRAINEPCRFCGNVCNTFKKLTVHLARHMEQLSMPILDLVKVKDVTPETVISPIEAKLPQASMSPSIHHYRESVSVSPFDRPMEVPTTMQELPGAFAPLSVVAGFQQPQYPNAMNWSQPTTQSLQVGDQSTPVFSSAVANPWVHTSGQYSNLGGSPANFLSKSPSMGANTYGQVPPSILHGLPGDSEQLPRFHNPQYMTGDNLSTAQLNPDNQRTGYENKVQPSYGRQESESTTLYAGHPSFAQQNLQHQQQQYFRQF